MKSSLQTYLEQATLEPSTLPLRPDSENPSQLHTPQTVLPSRVMNGGFWQAPEGQLLSFRLGFQETAWEDALLSPANPSCLGICGEEAKRD